MKDLPHQIITELEDLSLTIMRLQENYFYCFYNEYQKANSHSIDDE
jgi:hypothetical protein